MPTTPLLALRNLGREPHSIAVHSLRRRLAGATLLGAVCSCSQLTGLSNLYVLGEDASAADGGADALVTPGPPTSDASRTPTDDSGPVSSVGDGGGELDAGAPEDTGAQDDTGVPPPECAATAGPALVRVGAFCVDATEVTNDQYAAFLAASPALSLAPSPACTYKTSFAPSSAIPSGKGTLPVVWVDWCDAYAFCGWAGKHLCGAIDGGSSSKANAANKLVDEWYVACSTDGANVYPYGGNVYEQGKCNDSEAKSTGHARRSRDVPGCVGGYTGIFDMNGNAYEWEDACDVSAGASDSCVIRGGSWNFSGASYGGCNTYFNDYVVERSNTYNDTGFRCCDR